jgi:hypothetical protein
VRFLDKAFQGTTHIFENPGAPKRKKDAKFNGEVCTKTAVLFGVGELHFFLELSANE